LFTYIVIPTFSKALENNKTNLHGNKKPKGFSVIKKQETRTTSDETKHY